MTIYTAYFRTDADYAEREFEADTPEQALALARAFYEDHTEDLLFMGYDGGSPVNEIEVADCESDALAVWRDDQLRLQMAAGDLLEALEIAVERLEISNHAGEENAFIAQASAAIARAKGGAS